MFVSRGLLAAVFSLAAVFAEAANPAPVVHVVPRRGNATLLVPHSVGRVVHLDWTKLKSGDKLAECRPGWGMTYRMLAVLNESGESYGIVQKGARDYTSRLVARVGRTTDEIVLESHYDAPKDFTGPAPFETRLLSFAGGWFAAAEAYRAVVADEPWHRAARARDFGRLRDICMWFWNRRSSDIVIPPVEKFVADAGVPAALDWYWWHKTPYDTGYPNFWPPREPEADFRAAVKRLNAAGIYCQTYMNGMTWDVDDPSWTAGGERGVRRKPDGTYPATAWNRFSGHRLADMCGDAPEYQRIMRAQCRTLRGCGFDGQYLDMIGNGGYGCCWATNHNHAPGGGDHMVRNYRRYVEAVKRDNPGLQLCTEDVNETYMDLFDSVIVCATSYERFAEKGVVDFEQVPVFPAVYHGAIVMFGNFATLDGIPAWDPLWPDSERWTEEKEWEKLFPDQFQVEVARGVCWGLQPTVHNFKLNNATEPRYRTGYQFMIDTARFYQANRDLLLDGEMVDPGRLSCATQLVEFLQRGTYTKKGEYGVARHVLPTLFHSVWRNRGGRTAAVIANWSSKPQAYRLEAAGAIRAGTVPARSYVRVDLDAKYAWRGYMLDVSRHFFPVETVKKQLRLMHEVGLNVFHWHLTDGEGWRVESRKFPALTRKGPCYTQDEIRDVVACAKGLGITVVPEIEIPGHAYAACAAYPELGCSGLRNVGEYCLGKDATIRTLEAILDEVMELFPGEVIHLGGDECGRRNWRTCADCQKRIRTLGLAGEKALQAWATVHFAKYLEAHGRRMAGWDEIAEIPDLPKSAIVMCYRNQQKGAEAAKKGYDVVFSPCQYCYLDYVQGLKDDPHLYQPFGCVVSVEKIASFDPSLGLDGDALGHVLGGQGNLWTELVKTEGDLMWRTWPRLAALADVLTKGTDPNPAAFAQRIREKMLKIQTQSSRELGFAPVGPLFDARAGLVEGARWQYVREDFAQLKPCEITPTKLCFDWNDESNRNGKVFARKVSDLPSGAFRIELDWCRIDVEASDDAGFAKACDQLRRLARMKRGGAMEFTAGRIVCGETVPPRHTLLGTTVARAFTNAAGRVVHYRWSAPRHPQLGLEYPVYVVTDRARGDATVDDLRQSGVDYYLVSPDETDEASLATLGEWVGRFLREERTADRTRVQFVGAGEGAARAKRGAVTVVNVPWAFPSNRIDWLFNPTKAKGPFNPEWTWQLNRMFFWQDLAAAYRVTRDESYARAFAVQLRDWLDQTGGVPPEQGYNGVGSPWRTIEEGLRLMYAWPCAEDAFAGSPAFTPELKARFVAAMRAQAKHLMAHRTSRNWLLMEMTGVYTFATRHPEFPESEDWRKESARIFADEIRGQVLPDGMQVELSPDYHLVFFNCAAKLYRLAKARGFEKELPKDYMDVLERGAQAVLDLTTPSFVQPRFNDCYTIHAKWFLDSAAEFFPQRADFRWAATGRREGAPPAGATASRLLPWSGFAAMRSDWGPDAAYVAFDFGPLGAAHYHQDKLGFTFWKGGEELVFDDGGGQYDVSAHRAYALTGCGHNTLLVDGLPQNRRGPLTVDAPIDAGWTTTAARDMVRGTYDDGFGPNRAKLARHVREITLEKAQDLVRIADTVQSADGKEHDYELLFHVDTTNVTVAADGRSVTADYGTGRKWKLHLAVAEGGTISLASGQVKPRLSGWFVGRNDMTVHPATTISVKAERCRDRRFVTELKPVCVRP